MVVQFGRWLQPVGIEFWIGKLSAELVPTLEIVLLSFASKAQLANCVAAKAQRLNVTC